MGKFFSVLGALIILSYFIYTTLFIVDETEMVMVTQFGRPVRVVNESGPAFKLPDPVQSVLRFDKRLRTLDVPAAELVTRDGKNLIIGSFLIWKIVDPSVFLSSVRTMENAENRLLDLTLSESGVTIGSQKLESIFNTQPGLSRISDIFSSISMSVAVQAKKELGIEVITVLPKRLEFPNQNLAPLFERMQTERSRLANAYRAEGEEKAAKIRANTNKEVRELLAAASRDAQIERGKGEAEAARTYADAYSQAPELYRLQRTLEAYDKMLRSNATLVLPLDTPLFRYIMTPPKELQP